MTPEPMSAERIARYRAGFESEGELRGLECLDEIERLRGRLSELIDYTQHLTGCNANRASGSKDWHLYPCDCGLSALEASDDGQ